MVDPCFQYFSSSLMYKYQLGSVAEDAENFRCGGGLLDYVQILYGNKGSQQKYGLEVPQMKKNT